MVEEPKERARVGRSPDLVNPRVSRPRLSAVRAVALSDDITLHLLVVCMSRAALVPLVLVECGRWSPRFLFGTIVWKNMVWVVGGNQCAESAAGSDEVWVSSTYPDSVPGVRRHPRLFRREVLSVVLRLVVSHS